MAYPKQSLMSPVALHVAGVAFMIFWLSMPLSFAVQAWTDAVALEQRGADLEGTITRLWVDKGGDSTTYFGTYFYVVEWTQYHGQSSVQKEEWERLEVGGKVLVRYVADKPWVSASLLRRDITEKDGGLKFEAGLVLAFGAFGLAFLVGMGFSANAIRRRFWLRDHGVIRQASVLTSEKDEGKWDVTWRDDAGVEGKITGIKDRIRPEVGATITVFAHPTKPWPTVWEGDIGSR